MRMIARLGPAHFRAKSKSQGRIPITALLVVPATSKDVAGGFGRINSPQGIVGAGQ